MLNPALSTLLEQAEIERDAALARMLQADEAARQARAQADQLHAYREDYRRRAPALDGRSASIDLVRCHQGFMQRLDQAIEQQREQLARLEQGAAALRVVLLERDVRLATVKKLIERRTHEARRVHARAEQRHTDEAALRLAMARRH
jgi:flagellar FliJ protein